MTDLRMEPLPRGRHKLTAGHVRASQRARILLAMQQCVGEAGYAGTTVPQVTARARVSRTAYYAHFADKPACFTAMIDEAFDTLLGELFAFGGDGGDWAAALDAGLERYLGWWQERPDICRAFFVELPAAGEAALASRDRAFTTFARLFGTLGAWARAADPTLPPLRERRLELLVYGITELMAQEWRAGRVDRLAELHADLLDHTTRMLTDA